MLEKKKERKKNQTNFYNIFSSGKKMKIVQYAFYIAGICIFVFIYFYLFIFLIDLCFAVAPSHLVRKTV